MGNITINGITKDGNTVSWPSIVGAAGTVLTSDGHGNLIYSTPAGGGNVSTAMPFTVNNSITITDTTSGATNIKRSGVTLDAGIISPRVNTLTATTINGGTINGSSLARPLAPLILPDHFQAMSPAHKVIRTWRLWMGKPQQQLQMQQR